jgi:hypothetical protein
VSVTPEAGLEKQITIHPTMTGEQRLAFALSLHEFPCEITRAGIRQQYPQADPTEVERLLRRGS